MSMLQGVGIEARHPATGGKWYPLVRRRFESGPQAEDVPPTSAGAQIQP